MYSETTMISNSAYVSWVSITNTDNYVTWTKARTLKGV